MTKKEIRKLTTPEELTAMKSCEEGSIRDRVIETVFSKIFEKLAEAWIDAKCEANNDNKESWERLRTICQIEKGCDLTINHRTEELTIEYWEEDSE